MENLNKLQGYKMLEPSQVHIIKIKLDKIEGVINKLQEKYGITGLEKFDVINLLDEINEEL